ncbi:TonB-dependent receptor [Olivibacter ginsenosidimutans]|uniref:TonB-dependent receptor n=1 Tax=Olivibacter ginsenosidimutans TaxID=1176537 RepID=A0ABP9BHY9_9SPHI
MKKKYSESKCLLLTFQVLLTLGVPSMGAAEAIGKGTFRPVLTVTPTVQQQKVEGRVVDEQGNPLPGISILIKGTQQGTSTNEDGYYTLDVPPNAVLVYTYVGYGSKEEPVGTRTTINVTLTSSQQDLEEVVVIGYGEVKKKDLTGAVSVIDTKEMVKTGSPTIGQSIQGLASGVNVRNTSNAGGDASIEIRGVGTLRDNNPLWVIDGMITPGGADFNPNDVESIQILKDASAAAIYGSRAANGVIIVTTKKGANGPMKVGVDVKQSFDWSPKYDLMDAADFKKYNDMAYQEGIKDGVWNGGLQQHADYDTDWQKETLKTALVQDYNVSLSGGGESGNYFVSGGYYNNEGMMYGNSFDRYSFRVNTNGRKGIFSFGETLNLAQTERDPLQTTPYTDVIRMLPTIPVKDPNNPGGYGYGNETSARTFGTNPIAREDLEDTHNTIYRIRGSFWGQAQLTKWLSYKLNTGIDYLFDDYRYFRGQGNWTMNQEFRDPTGNKSNVRELTRLVENTFNFNKDFDKHHIDGVAGLTYQDFYREELGAQRLKFPLLSSGYITVLDAGQANQTNWNNIGEYALISYLARANYIYDEKYFLTATFRRDGTSKLGPANRWDNFYSISGAWRISNEAFFNSNWIDDLKLRANYGELGNAAIGNWDYLGTINPNIVSVFGVDQQLVNGATQVKIVNSDLRWEKSAQVNIGLDALFLHNRLGMTIEYYNTKSTDVLTAMPISMTTGNQGGAPLANAASLKNSGVELSANWKDQIGEVNYSLGANITTLSNKILALGYGNQVFYTGQTRSEIGRSLGEYYLLKTDGLFRTQEDIDRYVNSEGVPITIEGKRPQLGDLRYIDTDDNGQITTNDRQIVGSPWADFQIGFNAGASWKNFDFSMMWYGQFGNDVLNGAMRQGRLFADNSNYIRFEKGQEPYQENPNSDFPRIIYADTRNTRGDTDLWLEDGSYFRMRNVQLGYTFSSNSLTKIGLSNLRFYVSGNNLITITKYKGLDPDFINTDVWDRGTDNMGFPNARTVMFGLQVNF